MRLWILDAYLCRNVGDDLMVTELCSANPNETFVAPNLPGGRGPGLDALGNLSAGFGPWWIREGLRADGYVMCGGSMFIDLSQSYRSRLQFARRWVRRIVLAGLLRLRGKPVHVIGCNLGPIETRWGKVLFPAFLRLATRITVRDSASERIAKRWNLERVTKAPDMVLSYLAQTSPAVAQDSRAPLVGISVMEWPGLGPDATVNRYVGIIHELLSRDVNVRVRLFGFQDRIVRDDLMVMDLVRAFAEDPRVEGRVYRGDAHDFVRDFMECTRIIAVRFHAGILALGLGIPMVQIAYSQKVVDYLDDVGWPGLTLSPSDTSGESGARRLVGALLEAESFMYRPQAASIHAGGIAEVP